MIALKLAYQSPWNRNPAQHIGASRPTALPQEGSNVPGQSRHVASTCRTCVITYNVRQIQCASSNTQSAWVRPDHDVLTASMQSLPQRRGMIDNDCERPTTVRWQPPHSALPRARGQSKTGACDEADIRTG